MGQLGKRADRVDGLTARVAEITRDARLASAAKTTLGLSGQTEAQQIRQWQKLGLRPAPMACEFNRRPEQIVQTTAADAVRFLALADAAAALPDDRVVRLTCDLQQSVCARGIREAGGVCDDPTLVALTLYQVLAMRPLRRAHPIQWAEPTAADTNKPRQPSRPFWAYPEQFYNGSFPYGVEGLRYKVDENGHYGGGSPMADGAALLLFATAKTTPIAAGRGPTQVNAGQALPAIPQGCTRVIIEFGGGPKTVWKDNVAVEKGKLVALLPYLFGANDKLDAANCTFQCNTQRMTDGLALDVEGTNDTTVTMTCTPKGVSFSLGDLKAKQAIEAKVDGGNTVRATITK
jgi:hypothetical protein